MGPLLYLLYTADLPLPQSDEMKIGTIEIKSVQVMLTLKQESCPPLILNSIPIPQSEEAKYLGMRLNKRLTWKTLIFSKRKALGIKLRNLYSLLNPYSKVSLENNLLIYKTILKSVWAYGIQLWGKASNSNIKILQRFPSKIIGR